MRALPQILPAGLYEAASRRGMPRQGTGSRPTSDGSAAAHRIPRQFNGEGYVGQNRTQPTGYQSPMQTGDQWAVSPQDKAQFDSIFATVDTQGRGFITGDQAVTFFSNSRLPEDALAQIWDLADINSEGQLNRDEFAIAMYLIRQQRAKQSGRELLPQSLPAGLVPPSMRRQPIPPPQPTAPSFDNAANISKPKSASEDLFGLDAISTPPTQSKGPGELSALSPTSPTQRQTSPPPVSSQPASHFKPFVPSSSFGQTIMTPQATGSSSSPSPIQARGGQKQGSGTDDLLGDNDPEVSKRLTNETTELANLSNQVGTLTNQMSEVKAKRGVAEQNLGQAQTQKREFESRLAQLRTTYQQEVKEVQALEERLRVSREETKKLQSDIALIQGTHQDLQNQHHQVAEALNTDQTESARLKERISQTNAEINELKPSLEKMRSDARQQKGLVAIYKKQLAGSEAEREKFRGDMDNVRKEHEEATREAEESKRAAKAVPQTVQSPNAAVSSPAPSTASMNPFFRRSSSIINEKAAALPPSSPPNISSPNHNAFDSFFGPSVPASSGPPPTSFGSGNPSKSAEPETQDERELMTPPASPPPSHLSDSPQIVNEPPAPPQSRQITSSFLPLRPNLEHSDSESSSVKVVPPASRMSERASMSGTDTPTRQPSGVLSPVPPGEELVEASTKLTSATSRAETATVRPQEATVPSGLVESSGLPSAPRGVPGAFPGDEPEESHPDPFHSLAGPYSGSILDPRVDSAAAPLEDNAVGEVGAPFGGLDGKGKSPDRQTDKETNGLGSTTNHGEFPPIREFGGDDESDSEDEKGFGDDFTAKDKDQGKSMPAGLAPSRPPYTTTDSNQSQLPTPGAQQSPPTYDQTITSPPLSGTDRKDSNQFPAEYTGLLPSREQSASSPTSPPESGLKGVTNLNSSAGIDRGLSFFPSESTTSAPMAPGASTTAPYAYTQASTASVPSNPPIPSKAAIPTDDFEDEFGDLSEAKEASDRGEDDIPFSRSRNQEFDDFNPVFDSPAPPRATAQGSENSPVPKIDSFTDFEATPATGSGGSRGQPGADTKETPSHDWDAIFAGLDAPQNNGAADELSFTPTKSKTTLQYNGTAPESKKSTATADDASTDDPILKRLTGMGYPREKSLKALEKYDYNIDKVSTLVTYLFRADMVPSRRLSI